jgi:hypothetical protein
MQNTNPSPGWRPMLRLSIPALKAIRETKGYSIEELSLTCGLSTSEIADIESGKDTIRRNFAGSPQHCNCRKRP